MTEAIDLDGEAMSSSVITARARRTRRSSPWMHRVTVAYLGVMGAAGLALAVGAALVVREVGVAISATLAATALAVAFGSAWGLGQLGRQRSRMRAIGDRGLSDDVRLLIEHDRARLFWWWSPSVHVAAAIMTLAAVSALLATWLETVARGDDFGRHVIEGTAGVAALCAVALAAVAWRSSRRLRAGIDALVRLQRDLAEMEIGV